MNDFAHGSLRKTLVTLLPRGRLRCLVGIIGSSCWFFMAFGFTFFQSLSVQLKAECNKGYVKVKQVCLFVSWTSMFYLMIVLHC